MAIYKYVNLTRQELFNEIPNYH